jgi:hypothetical protein
MTNDILDNRRKNLVKKNIEGRESLDEGEVFHFTPINRNFSVYAKDQAEEKPREKETTVAVDLNVDTRPDLVEPPKAVQQSVEDTELSISMTQELDESKLSVFDRSLEKTQGENKLAELNNLLKQKKTLNINKDDEEDFEKFLTRLHSQRSESSKGPISERAGLSNFGSEVKSQVAMNPKPPKYSPPPKEKKQSPVKDLLPQKVLSESELEDSIGMPAFKINLSPKASMHLMNELLTGSQQRPVTTDARAEQERDRSPSPSFYSTFAKHEKEGGIPSPSKKYGEESPDKRSATRYG